MLKKRYESEDDIPDAVRDYYEEQSDGSYALKLADDDGGAAVGGVSKRKLKEMRDNNIELRKQLETMQEKLDRLGDIDPDTVKAAMDNLARTKSEEELELLRTGKLDEVVSRRTRAMQENYQKQLEQLEQQRKETEAAKQKARERFSSVFLESQVGSALEKKKLRIRPTARQDLLMRARSVFQPDDELEALVPTDPALVGNDGGDLSLETWLDKMVDDAPHLFDGGNGGGARPIGSGGRRQVFDPATLSAEEFTRAAEAVNQGKGEWKA